jgi:NAD+ kinase
MRLEERLMIRAEVVRDDRTVYSGVGLNDVLVKSKMSHTLQLKTYLGGALFATYPADGIVVATPTGSTAYALSAGGPLVFPTLQTLIMAPICPHTLSARPMIVPAEEKIAVEVESDGEHAICAVDGVEPFDLESGDIVQIRRADWSTRLIVLNHATFYGKVRARYLYGERLNE